MARSPDPAHLPTPHRAAVRGAIAAGVAVLALALTACTGSATSADSASRVTAAAGATMAAQPAPAADGAATAAAEGSGASAGSGATDDLTRTAPAVVPGDARQLIRTAELGVRLKVPTQGSSDADDTARTAALDTAVGDARAAVVAAGGVVASSEGSGDRTTLGLRIPVDAYDAALDRLTGLGEVDRRTESSLDVTAELVDVGSRIASMTASVDRVRALLAQATDVGQVVTIEGELARREADLESLQRQQASLAGQVALSTVTLTLTAVTTGTGTSSTSPDDDSGFAAGLSSGWSALLGLLSGAGTVAGALLPFLPLFAVGGGLLWWVWRRRRRSAGPLAASTATGPAPTG